MEKLQQPEKADSINIQRVRNGFLISTAVFRADVTMGTPYVADSVTEALTVLENLMDGECVEGVDYMKRGI